jgi:hypothetical protein
MAGKYVRDTIRAWLAGQPVPYVDTVSLEPGALALPCVTVEWGFSDRQRITTCDEEETGTFSLIYIGEAGQGDAALLADAEAHASTLLARADPNRRLILERARPPADYWLDSPYYACEIQVDYTCAD